MTSTIVFPKSLTPTFCKSSSLIETLKELFEWAKFCNDQGVTIHSEMESFMELEYSDEEYNLMSNCVSDYCHGYANECITTLFDDDDNVLPKEEIIAQYHTIFGIKLMHDMVEIHACDSEKELVFNIGFHITAVQSIFYHRKESSILKHLPDDLFAVIASIVFNVDKCCEGVLNRELIQLEKSLLEKSN